MNDDKGLVEHAKEVLAVAHERANRPLVAVDIRSGNIGGQGVRWVEIATALSAIQLALETSDKDARIQVLSDRIAVLEETMRGARGYLVGLGKQGEDNIWRPAKRYLAAFDDALTPQESSSNAE